MPTRKKTVQALQADVFTAIAHPVRRGILERLRDGAFSASDLAEPFDVSRSAVSQHLGILLEAGLVSRETRGRERMYRLQVENLNELHVWLQMFDELWRARLDSLESFLDDLRDEEEADS